MGSMSASAAGQFPPPPANELSDDDVALLECEREMWGPSPLKEAAVAKRFGTTMPAYYQRLYRLCQSEAAMKYDQALVRHILDTADQLSARRHQVISGRGTSRG